MPKLSILRLILFVCLAVVLSSCNEDRDKDGIDDNDDKCPTVFAKTKDGCPIKTEIKKIHLYLETSASMGGYFNGDTEFKTILTDLASKVDGEIKPVDIWFISDTMTRYQGSVQKFSTDIAITRIADKKSSELQKIFTEVAAKTDSDEVSFVVSDCILSFSNEDIKRHPDINKTEANNSLREGIYSAFLNLKKKRQAVSVYGFKSRFNGVYYDYQNVKVTLRGTERPFYIWVIANKDVLRGFNEQLAQISTFKPEYSLHFGLIEQPVTDYGILTQIEKNGSWNKDDKTHIVDVELPKNDSLKFCLSLNLDSLPAYAKSPAYLQKNLQITKSGCAASFRVKLKTEEDTSRINSPAQLNLLRNATHLLIISVANMNTNDAQISFQLPMLYDTWYTDWSCIDDKNIALQNPQQTFAFEYLINGVKEAYETRNKKYINFSIQLSK